MKSIKIANLKQNFSRYLRMVRKGESITVMDRSEPVAELIPIRDKDASAHDRLVREGKIRPATSSRDGLEIKKLGRKFEFLDLLIQVREDSR
ncbi:type II toxin-antitoxin system prevent-host-death family antitoxin [Bdellovibrionota bacterium FG-2]